MADPTLAAPQMPAAPAMPASPIPDGSTGPATTMPQSAGMEAQAPMWVDAALNMLRKAMPNLDPKSEQGKAIHKAALELAGAFGKPSPDLTRASMKLAEESMPATPGPSDPAAFLAMMQQIGANSAGQPAPAPAPQMPAPVGV